MTFYFVILTVFSVCVNVIKITVYSSQEEAVEINDFILHSKGCKIPNLNIRYNRFKLERKCEKRKILVGKASTDAVRFIMLEVFHDCCYKFFYSSNESYTQIKYTDCTKFGHGSTARVQGEFLKIECENNYEDVFAIVYKKSDKLFQTKHNKWNVLVIGIESMSRSQLVTEMTETRQFLNKNLWHDYKAYNKVTVGFPNLINILKVCHYEDMKSCKNVVTWTALRQADFVTAYATDALNMPETFNQFNHNKNPPIDHFIGPLFYEDKAENQEDLYCTNRLTSGEHVLNYALDFVDTYSRNKFFGFFWIESFNNNASYSVKQVDEIMSNFFKKLKQRKYMLRHTFIIFCSDHGIKYGRFKEYVNSFYEERLPLLFIWAPQSLSRTNPEELSNLHENENRLVTPYDVLATIWDIVTASNEDLQNEEKRLGCQNCVSLFYKISGDRTCRKAGISEHSCTCNTIMELNTNSYPVYYSMVQSLIYLYNTTKAISTQKCTRCNDLSLKKMIRVHSFYDRIEGKEYYLLAFTVKPGNINYEVLVAKNDKFLYNVVPPVARISERNNESGNCVMDKKDMDYCVCKKKESCQIKPKKVAKPLKRKKKLIRKILRNYLKKNITN